MRNKSTYDWEWFECHAPFKKTLEKFCRLEIRHERHKYFGITGDVMFKHHFIITYDKAAFARYFNSIKSALLCSNVCKHNADVKDFVEKLKCDQRSFCDLVLHGCGCIKYRAASFEWHDMSKKEGVL